MATAHARPAQIRSTIVSQQQEAQHPCRGDRHVAHRLNGLIQEHRRECQERGGHDSRHASGDHSSGPRRNGGARDQDGGRAIDIGDRVWQGHQHRKTRRIGGRLHAREVHVGLMEWDPPKRRRHPAIKLFGCLRCHLEVQRRLRPRPRPRLTQVPGRVGSGGRSRGEHGRNDRRSQCNDPDQPRSVSFNRIPGGFEIARDRAPSAREIPPPRTGDERRNRCRERRSDRKTKAANGGAKTTADG